jgi:hypothetical protein
LQLWAAEVSRLLKSHKPAIKHIHLHE